MTENQTDAKDSIIFECFEIARNSEDPDTGVGACIVKQDRDIIAKGYNHMPKIKEGCTEEYQWNKDDSAENWLKSKYAYVVYAEMDAIINAKCSVKDCTMYTLIYPGNECAKMIVESGIKEVIYYLDKREQQDYREAAETIFRRAGIEVIKYEIEDEANRFKISDLELETIRRDEKRRLDDLPTPET